MSRLQMREIKRVKSVRVIFGRVMIIRVVSLRFVVAGLGIEPSSQGYEPCEIPFLHPAICFFSAEHSAKNDITYSTNKDSVLQVLLRKNSFYGSVYPYCSREQMHAGVVQWLERGTHKP